MMIVNTHLLALWLAGSGVQIRSARDTPCLSAFYIYPTIWGCNYLVIYTITMFCRLVIALTLNVICS